jgi:DNA-binding transcriptional ArsR family regulator
MSDEQLSRDQVFDILSSPRRRYVLYYLREYGGPVELTDLAEKLAAWENDTTVEALPPQARKRVYVSLYQTHVPKLEEAGLIVYDSDSGELALAEDDSPVDPYLGEQTKERPWYLYYLAAIVASAGLLLGVLGGLIPLSLTLTVGIVMGAFLLLAGAHTIIGYRDSGQSTEFEEL